VRVVIEPRAEPDVVMAGEGGLDAPAGRLVFRFRRVNSHAPCVKTTQVWSGERAFPWRIVAAHALLAKWVRVAMQGVV
jgi:hypothetical protein